MTTMLPVCVRPSKSVRELRLEVRHFLDEQRVLQAYRPDVDAWQSGIDLAYGNELVWQRRIAEHVDDDVWGLLTDTQHLAEGTASTV